METVFKAMAQGHIDREVDVARMSHAIHGEMMVIMASSEAIYVTKAQAMAFFGLVDSALALKAAKWDALMRAAGHLDNGSETTVTLSQDDATRTAFIKVGKQSYFQDRCGFDSAMHLLMAEQALNPEDA